jgi:hypothetical protein
VLRTSKDCLLAAEVDGFQICSLSPPSLQAAGTAPPPPCSAGSFVLGQISLSRMWDSAKARPQTAPGPLLSRWETGRLSTGQGGKPKTGACRLPPNELTASLRSWPGSSQL